MELLILGGTRFVGRHITEAARARGHTVTLFHRGASSPDGLPGAPEYAGFYSVNCDRARGAGLGERPLLETVRDTQRWDAGRENELKMGLGADREAELLALWRTAGARSDR